MVNNFSFQVQQLTALIALVTTNSPIDLMLITLSQKRSGNEVNNNFACSDGMGNGATSARACSVETPACGHRMASAPDLQS
ncbi:hypothetical protein QUA94_35180, partial [Microcoleus sp. F8-D2]